MEGWTFDYARGGGGESLREVRPMETLKGALNYAAVRRLPLPLKNCNKPMLLDGMAISQTAHVAQITEFTFYKEGWPTLWGPSAAF